MIWPTASLGEVATIERNSVAASDIQSGSRYVGLEHIESGGASLAYGEVTNGEIASNKFRFGPQHILFGKLRPYLAKIVCPDFEGICSTDILPIAPGKRVDRRYLLNFLLLPRTIDWAASRATGVNLPRLSPNELASLEIPLPPLDEQRRIATVLDKANDLRRKRKRALELLDNLAQSTFMEMFGDPVSNPKRWPSKKLTEFESFLTSGSRGWAKYYSESGRAFIRIQNLQGGQLSTDDLIYVNAPENAEAKRTTVESGDVLISITADLGRTAVVPIELHRQAHINQHIALFRSRNINPVYLSMYLASAAGQRQFASLNRQGVKAGLNFDNIRDLSILEPPLEKQNEYADRLGLMRSIAEKSTSESIELSSLFSSLQHRAFSGQL